MPASKLPRVGTTIFTVMSRLAAEAGAINLGQGFPDFDPPARLRELVAEHLARGHNQYAAMAGLPDQEQADQRDKHPVTIILAANPVAKQEGQTAGIQVTQEGNGDTAGKQAPQH